MYTPGTPYVTGTIISSTVANSVNSDFATGLSTAITKDGQTTITANIPFGGNKITGLGAATLPTDAVQYQQLQSGSSSYLTSVSGTNTITASLTNPTLTAYAAGQVFRFVSTGANTGAATININSIGAKTIQKNGAALVAGDILNGTMHEIGYDGTNFQLIEGVQANSLQLQTYTAFTTGGTSSAFTLTPTPAITANAANQLFFVKFNVAPTGSTTMAISGQTALNVKYYDSTGAKQFVTAAVVPINWQTYVWNDGTDLVVMNVLSPTIYAVQSTFKNLQASSTGLSANVTVTCDEIMVEDTSNNYKTLRTVSLTIAGTSVAINALDAGTIAASTWYSIWVIHNGTTTAGLMSLSATAPTMPSGYTYKARVGWIRTDGTANKYPFSFIQAERDVQYKVASGSNLTALPTLASGVQGSVSVPTWVATSVSTLVPTTAAKIKLVAIDQASSSTVMAAPNNSYGANSSTSNPPPLVAMNFPNLTSAEFILESTNVYYAGQGSTSIVQCMGWKDNI